jgi:RNA polymerase sigma-70 factor (ECF subfamily)
MLAKEAFAAALPPAASPAEPLPMEDVSLAQALIEGRREAAPFAWRRFHPIVQGTLRRMLGSGPDLADLTQEVFLRFFGKVRELRKLESLRFFVTSIAIRRAQEEIKRRRVRRWAAPQLLHSVQQPARAASPEARDMLSHVARVMGALDPVDRSVYILRHVDGLELAEIARTLDTSISTVRRRLRRVATLVEALDEDRALDRPTLGRA